jgi:hypothetical protein
MARDCVQTAIYLRSDQLPRLGRVAQAKRVSAAAIIRAAVDAQLDAMEALPGDAVPAGVVAQIRPPGGLRLSAKPETQKHGITETQKQIRGSVKRKRRKPR